MTPRPDDASPVWARDLSAQARRIFALFGGRSADARRDDDDDDDLPRPNAVVLRLFSARPAALA